MAGDTPKRIGLLDFDPDAALTPEMALTQQARELRQRMRRQLGEAEARRVWDEVGKKPRGRIPGSTVYDMTNPMHVFDELSKTPDFARSAREQIAREVAEYAHSVHPGRFGATAEGVLASLKRALKNRDAKRAEHEAEWQAFLARQRSAPGTLSFSANQTPFPNALLAAMNMPPDKKGG